MSEKKFEPSTLEKATHIYMGGKVHKLEIEKITLEFYDGKCLGMGLKLIEKRMWIPIELFSILGIQPIKEIKPKPVEFEATFIKHDGKWYPSYSFSLDDSNYQNSEKATFKCVQIVEDEE